MGAWGTTVDGYAVGAVAIVSPDETGAGWRDVTRG